MYHSGPKPSVKFRPIFAEVIQVSTLLNLVQLLQPSLTKSQGIKFAQVWDKLQFLLSLTLATFVIFTQDNILLPNFQSTDESTEVIIYYC